MRTNADENTNILPTKAPRSSQQALRYRPTVFWDPLSADSVPFLLIIAQFSFLFFEIRGRLTGSMVSLPRFVGRQSVAVDCAEPFWSSFGNVEPIPAFASGSGHLQGRQ